MSDRLAQMARDKPCQVRLSGICNYDPATTVLAHFRMSGISGMGIKASSLIGAWACHACHEVVDGRRFPPDLSREAIRLAFLEGVIRTQAELVRLGVVTW